MTGNDLGYEECLNSLAQDTKYFDFPKTNMYMCLTYKFQVVMDTQFNLCKNNANLTMSQVEDCMEDIYKNNVMGWKQGKYVSLRKIPKPVAPRAFYRFDSKFTSD